MKTKVGFEHSRRDFLRLAGLGGVVLVSGLGTVAQAAESAARSGGARHAARSGAGDFHFVQLSDPHWGFEGPSINPDSGGTLVKAVAAVNALEVRPDFVIFTGDLTHTTDDDQVRRDRLKGFRDVAGQLNAKKVYFMAGEHDAALDEGEAFQKQFGKLHYSFDHKGVHFIVLDNVSNPAATIGDKQLAWLKTDLARLRKEQPIVVFTHRPLFDLYPDWDWATRDGAAAIDALLPHPNVTVFYGHIHQENHHQTAHISHHSAKSLMFALPAPGSVPKKAPIPWNPDAPYQGLGFREVGADGKGGDYALSELPVKA